MAGDRSRHDSPCWMWSNSERCYIWWDGGEFTDSRCHWSGTAWVPSDGLHDPPLAGPPPADPGWYELADEPQAHRYWDGSAWTAQIRRPVTSKGWAIMLSLVATGIALVVVGGWIATGSNLWNGTIDCSADDLPGPAPLLWLLWLALVTVTTLTAATRHRYGPHHRLMKWLVQLGVWATALTFPGWLWLGAGMNCGL